MIKQAMILIKAKGLVIPLGLLVLFATSYAKPYTIDVEIPQIIAATGDTITVPITITSDLTGVTPGIIAVSIQLTWKSNVLKYINVAKSPIIPPGWIMLSSNGSGPGIDSLKLNMAGTSALTNKGDLIVITYEVKGEPGDLTPIHVEDMLFNEGDPTAHFTDGAVTIVAPLMADFSASDTIGSPPFTVSFGDLSSGYITGWLWQFGDNTTSTEQEPTHSYQDTGTYTVRLKVTNPAGFDIKEKQDYIKVKWPVSTNRFSSTAKTPSVCSLSQNFPNPFNAETVIKYQLSRSSTVTLKIFDTLGREVKTIIDEEMNKGYYEAHWDGTNNKGSKVSSGIYILKLKTRNFTDVRKMLLLY